MQRAVEFGRRGNINPGGEGHNGKWRVSAVPLRVFNALHRGWAHRRKPPLTPACPPPSIHPVRGPPSSQSETRDPPLPQSVFNTRKGFIRHVKHLLQFTTPYMFFLSTVTSYCSHLYLFHTKIFDGFIHVSLLIDSGLTYHHK